MIRSNLLSLKPGTGLLGISGSLQKGNIEKRRFQFGLMEGPIAFLNLLVGNMSFIGKHNGKASEEGIVSLRKGLCSKEGCKDGGAGIHRSDREVIANFFKGCGFNEREIEKIVYAIRDNSGLPNVKNKASFANEKVFGESIASLQKGLCSKEGSKDWGAGIHRSDREVIANFFKGCGLNEREIEKIVNAIRDDSGPPNMKIKEPTVVGEKGVIKGLPDIGGEKEGESSPAVFVKDRGEKKNFRCTPVVVGHNENQAEIEKSLSEVGTKELSDRRTETFHKGIRLDNLINESFSGGKPQHNISHVSNVPVDVNEGDIKPRILIKQIVEGAGKKLSNGVGRVKIALHPPHLGTLHMDIVLNNNKVQVILQVENNKVRHILQLNVEQLKNSLHSQGLIVDNVNVSLQERTGDTNYGFEQNRYLFKEGRNRGENREDQGDERDFLSHDSSILDKKESGLQKDGRISLFA